MWRRGKGGLRSTALFCVAAALVMPASATAAEGAAGAVGAFRLKGTNGYSILVDVLGLPGDSERGQVLIGVLRDRTAVAVYFVPATVTGDPLLPLGAAGTATSIQADLGALGGISFTFHPSGETKTDRSCDGRPSSYSAGTYQGTFEFHGEEGYTRAIATRTALKPELLHELECGGSRSVLEEGGPGLPGARLYLTSRKHGQYLSLQVNKNHQEARVTLEAILQERRGRIAIIRQVRDRMPSQVFSFDPMLRTATLSPPAPFSGHATFRRAAAPVNRWRGNLSIDFPGESNLPLTGSGLQATLRHARLTEQIHLNRGESERPGAFVSIWGTNAPLPILRSQESRRGSTGS
jgi:hypothetical protein